MKYLYTPRYKNKENGYIALVSAVIMAAIIMLIVITLSVSAFMSRVNVADAHFKEKSRSLAEACLEIALLRLADSASYGGGENVTVGSDTCEIRVITTAGSQKTIETTGEFQSVYSNLRVVVEGDTLSLVSREEVKSF